MLREASRLGLRDYTGTDNLPGGVRLGHRGTAMTPLENLDWRDVRRQYDLRIGVSGRLRGLHESADRQRFAKLAVGLDDADANYSATVGKSPLGPAILQDNLNACERIFGLAGKFIMLSSARSVPLLVRQAGIKYLSIAVGSEMSCMVNPGVCWVANRRTLWAHLAVKHADDLDKADAELDLYRDGEEASEMAYRKWEAIHAELPVALTRIAEQGRNAAIAVGVEPGKETYIWADAIASQLYEAHRRRASSAAKR